MPLISVLMPTHRVDALFVRALKSVLSQSLQPFEVIVVTDGIWLNLESLGFVEKKNQVKVINLPQNSGPAHARNVGIKAASGNYIAMIDSDDYWHKDKLKIQVGLIEETKLFQNVVCVTPVTVVRDGANLFARYPILGCDVHRRDLLNRCPYLYLGSTLLAPAATLHLVGPYNDNQRAYEDFDWQIRANSIPGLRFISTGVPLVFIEKGFHLRSSNELLTSKLELENTVRSLSLAPEKQVEIIKKVTALYHLDIAKIDFFAGNYLSFCFHVLKSFLSQPRLCIRTGKFWNEVRDAPTG